MARKAFYSFHYVPDNWRASQVRNIGVIEGNVSVTDHDWESITGGGDAAIQRWIDNQLSGKGCTIVLIGTNTAGRKWIDYEIKKSWDDRKGILGIHIHNLKDVNGNQSLKGSNPFTGFNIKGVNFANIVNTYDPPYFASTNVYNYIAENIASWVDEAIKIRANY